MGLSELGGGGGPWGNCPPQYLADQLSLSQPGRADYAYHNNKYLPPRFSDFPTALSSAHTNTLCFYLASKVKWHSWLITWCAWIFSPNKRDFVSYFQSLFKGPEATKFVYSVVSSGSTQGPLKKWTEHLNQSHFLELQLREDHRSTFSVGFLHHELLWCRKVHIKIFLMRVKLYFEPTKSWSWSSSNISIFWQITGLDLLQQFQNKAELIRSNLSCNSQNRVFRPRRPWSTQLECCVKPVKITRPAFFSCLEKLPLIMIVLTAPIIGVKVQIF